MFLVTRNDKVKATVLALTNHVMAVAVGLVLFESSDADLNPHFYDFFTINIKIPCQISNIM